MLRIHGIPRSRALRNIWTAEEAGLAYEVVPTGFDAAKDPVLGHIHPAGKVPALEDGPLILQESLAINLHIAMKAGAPLMPQGDDLSRTLQWTMFAGTEAEPQIMAWAYNTYVRPPEQRNPAEAARGLSETLPRLAFVEAHLAGRDWLVGSAFSVADLNLASVYYGAWLNGFDFAASPRVKAWLDRCLTRPAAKAARALRE
ncbi:MAG: glutathione S-transferase family protein [Alphaproteobacteria bacterium]|nr:glutathione S-transferase family protein [Alphaproteobacteria bacterium]